MVTLLTILFAALQPSVHNPQDEAISAIKECAVVERSASFQASQSGGLDVDRRKRLMWVSGEQPDSVLACLKAWTKEHGYGLVIVHR